jgi:hypothetical protein
LALPRAANDNRASVGRRIARLVPFLAAASAVAAAALWSAFG